MFQHVTQKISEMFFLTNFSSLGYLKSFGYGENFT